MTRLEQLKAALGAVGAAEEDFPGQHEEMRREAIIRAAISAADELILYGSNGDEEDTALLTSSVALRFVEKTQQAINSWLRAGELRKQAREASEKMQKALSPPSSDDPSNVVSAIHGECDRVRKIVPLYESIGATGAFAIAMMRAAIQKAEKAIAANDGAACAAALAELRGFKE